MSDIEDREEDSDRTDSRQVDDPERMSVDSFGCSRRSSDGTPATDQFVVAELKRAARVHHASSAALDKSRRFGDNQAHVLLVADGIHGEQNGAQASRMVVEEVMESILNAVPWNADLDAEMARDLERQLKDTVVRCNDQVIGASRRSASDEDFASTLTLAFVRWPKAYIVHAGDSRAYLLRGGGMERLTTDHTYAQQMVDNGTLPGERAETSRFARILWNAVGGDGRVTPELTVRELQGGDALLLCSDGLTRYLNDESIQYMVHGKQTAQASCEELIRAVDAIGGPEDATAAMARFLTDDAATIRQREPLPVRTAGAALEMAAAEQSSPFPHPKPPVQGASDQPLAAEA